MFLKTDINVAVSKNDKKTFMSPRQMFCFIGVSDNKYWLLTDIIN